MAIRIYIILMVVIQNFYYSQNIDSINAIYNQYYETSLLSASPSGRYAVLNHHNTYGKDEVLLLDAKTGKEQLLNRYFNYQFLDNDHIFMLGAEYSRFLNLKTGKYTDLPGKYSSTIITRKGEVLIYKQSSNELFLCSKSGEVLFNESNIGAYDYNIKNNQLYYISGENLIIRDLTKKQSRNYKLDSGVQWISSNEKKIYCATLDVTQLMLYTLDLQSDKVTKQIIESPQDFQFATSLNTYFEIRENQHFVFPMYLKTKLNEKTNTELKITYSNKNSREKFLNHYLGIYNIEEEKWDYSPDSVIKQPFYRFLNEKGDFVVIDKSNDIVEEQQNAVLDLNLVLDYGKSAYLLPDKRVDDTNYLWDKATEKFIYFNKKRWICHHLRTGEDHELLPLDINGWENQDVNGLADFPETIAIKIKDKSDIILSNQFDYFVVNLKKNHNVKRITKGVEEDIKYEIQLSKNQYAKSPWNIKFAETDFENEMIFKLFNLKNYESGFASYQVSKDKTVFYKQGHYSEIIPCEKGFLFASNFALEPFKLTKFEKGEYQIVYESLKKETQDFKKLRYQIFRYQTKYGTSNAVLLFPIDYDKQKEYPLVVNIYEENQSGYIRYFLPPYLNARDGFNYMHYLLNGYFVLLPDLQYLTGNIKASMIESLEKSIDDAQKRGSIDKNNIAVLGLSFGGYGTGLALTNSTYFKTGIAGVMVSDLIERALSNSEIAAEPNYRRVENRQYRMGGSLFDSWDNYNDHSPIYHLKNMNVPALIWTGLKDTNVSPKQSKMFFLGMKRLSKKAVLLEYFNDSHTISLEQNQFDLNLRIFQWFEYFLKNKSPADWIKPILK